MLPTKKFNELPVVTSLEDSDKLFCIANGVDSLITIENLKLIFGTGQNYTYEFPVTSDYSLLSGLAYGGEYHESPYIYKITENGIVRINADTVFDTPSGTGVTLGFVVSTFNQLLVSPSAFEYHEGSYVYKKYSFGTFRINGDTVFAAPTGTGAAEGFVVSSISALSGASIGYEYHEGSYVYKKSLSGILRINCDTIFAEP